MTSRFLARRWPRYPTDGPIKVLSDQNSTKMMVFGRLRKISEGGLAFTCRQSLNIDDQVELEFELPVAKSAVRLQAIVRSSRGDTYGVEFCDPGARQKQGLMVACNALSLRQPSLGSSWT